MKWNILLRCHWTGPLTDLLFCMTLKWWRHCGIPSPATLLFSVYEIPSQLELLAWLDNVDYVFQKNRTIITVHC